MTVETVETVEMGETEETEEMVETITQETHTTETLETGMMDATETGVLTIPLVTSNDLRGLPPSSRS